MAQPTIPNSIEGYTPEAAAAIVRLAKALDKNPDVEERITFYKMAKKVDPATFVPADVQMEMLKRELNEKDNLREIERRASETRTRLETQRRSLIESGRYDETTVQKIEKEVMEARGISDYETAAVLYAHQNPEINPSISANDPRDAAWKFPWQGGTPQEIKKRLANPWKQGRERMFAELSKIKQKA